MQVAVVFVQLAAAAGAAARCAATGAPLPEPAVAEPSGGFAALAVPGAATRMAIAAVSAANAVVRDRWMRALVRGTRKTEPASNRGRKPK